MNGLLLSLFREGAHYIGREIARRSAERIVAAIAVGAIVSILASAALVFLYILLFDLIARDQGEEAAAAILCGGNLLLIALIVIGRALLRGKRARPRTNLGGADLEAALELGQEVAKDLRKFAPEASIVALILGLAVGARPELLDLLRGRKK